MQKFRNKYPVTPFLGMDPEDECLGALAVGHLKNQDQKDGRTRDDAANCCEWRV